MRCIHWFTTTGMHNLCTFTKKVWGDAPNSLRKGVNPPLGARGTRMGTRTPQSILIKITSSIYKFDGCKRGCWIYPVFPICIWHFPRWDERPPASRQGIQGTKDLHFGICRWGQWQQTIQTEDEQCWMFSMLLFCFMSMGFSCEFLCPNFWVSQGFKFLNGSSDAIEWQAERLQGSGYLRLFFCSHYLLQVYVIQKWVIM